MSLTGRKTLRSTLRRIAVTGLAVAATAGGATVTAPGADAASAGSPAAWARTATGLMVQVPTTQYPTPVRPEAIIHPDADHMGSTVAAHMPARTGTSAVPIPGLAPAVRSAAAVPQLPGIDISSYQGSVAWSTVSKSIDFAYIKATEGTYYTNADFASQYDGAYNAGVIRGSYHFAIPNNSTGSAQADYFIAHGGDWSSDGKTLPGALDIEYNPYGAECYGLTQSQMVSWVHSFANEYAAKEHVYPVIYTTTDWWTSCTGNSSAFAADSPLWVANYTASGGGTLPAGWGYYTFWQYADSGSEPGDQDVFNGAYSRLQALATSG